MDGKTIIVTGGGRGIGREIALLAGRHGCNVVVNDLGVTLGGAAEQENPAAEVADIINNAGGRAIANADSVADPKGAQSIIDAAMDNFGGLDGVVNNAGNLRDGMFHKMPVDDWETVIGVHLMGTFYVARAAAQRFRAQQSGAFVHMTSTSGLIGTIGQANYGAAKLGIAGLSKAIALDMAHFNVRSNAIAPFAWSRMTSSLKTETPEQKRRVERLKQMTPEKIAPLAVYLLSDRASDVTGQIFGVRRNEIYLFSQPRPIRSVHAADGWSVETIADHAMPALSQDFYPLETTADVFGWDPV